MQSPNDVLSSWDWWLISTVIVFLLYRITGVNDSLRWCVAYKALTDLRRAAVISFRERMLRTIYLIELGFMLA